MNNLRRTCLLAVIHVIDMPVSHSFESDEINSLVFFYDNVLSALILFVTFYENKWGCFI